MPLPHQAWKAIGEGWWASNELDFLTEILKIGQDYIKKEDKILTLFNPSQILEKQRSKEKMLIFA